MTNNKIGIYDHTTGEQSIREMTSEEKENRDAEIALSLANKEAKKSEAEAKAEAKTALLERLGLTEDEAKLLLS
jgi:hypothetical protein